ncbi:hypothetical protein D3C80_2143800 [compost metagenome]
MSGKLPSGLRGRVICEASRLRKSSSDTVTPMVQELKLSLSAGRLAFIISVPWKAML